MIWFWQIHLNYRTSFFWVFFFIFVFFFIINLVILRNAIINWVPSLFCLLRDRNYFCPLFSCLTLYLFHQGSQRESLLFLRPLGDQFIEWSRTESWWLENICLVLPGLLSLCLSCDHAVAGSGCKQVVSQLRLPMETNAERAVSAGWEEWPSGELSVLWE